MMFEQGRARSIRGRLLRNFLLFSVSVLLAVASVYVFNWWQSRDALADDQIEELAEQLVRDAERGPDGMVRITLSDRTTMRLAKVAGFAAYVYDLESGTVVYETRVGFKDSLPLQPTAELRRAYLVIDRLPGTTPDIGSQVLLTTIDTAAGPMRVVAMRDEPLYEQQMSAMLRDLSDTLPITGPIFILTLLIALYTVRSALGPVKRAAEQADRIDVESMGARLDTAVPNELRPLVAAVNRALERIDRGFREQRRFTATAAHELRTPLAVLSARLDAVGDAALVEAMRVDVGRMSRVIEQLLAVSRLDSQMKMEMSPVDLAVVAQDVVVRLAPIAVANGKQISLTAPDSLEIPEGNADALEAALRNLVDNALRYTPDGETVDVTVEKEGADTGSALFPSGVGAQPLAPRAVIEVRDRGVGIKGDDRAHLFERFWRGRDRSGGAGLGLAIVAEIAAQHGGRAAMRPAPGGGSVFRIELPLAA